MLKERLVGDSTLPMFVVLNENKSNPMLMDLDLRDYRYSAFLSMLNEHVGYHIKLPGILDDFESLVDKFISAPTTEKNDILTSAQQKFNTMDSKKDLSDAEYYVTVIVVSYLYN